jgi:glycosyltransferase involved in cell wall biosynthesis
VKVLLVQSFLHPRGGDTTCASLLRERLEADGVEVIPFAMRHPDNEPSPWETRFPPWRDARGGTTLSRARAAAGSIWSRRAARDLARLLRDVRPDVAHVHHVHRHLTPSVLWPLAEARVPVVWTVHDYELLCPAGTLHAPNADAPGTACSRCTPTDPWAAVRLRCKRDDVAQSALFAVEKWVHGRLAVLERIERFIAPSAFLAGRLRAQGVPAERVRHVPNGVRPSPATALVPDGPVLYAGRLAAEKGVDDVLAAALRAPERAFRIVGDGPDAARLRRGAPPNVRFVGPVAPEEVATELAAASVVLVPSRWPENDPYAVVEAQMAGRPVVAADVGGIPEQIRDGEDGLLFRSGDVDGLSGALRRLAADPTGAARIGEAARRRVLRERAPERWVLAIREIYRELGA